MSDREADGSVVRHLHEQDLGSANVENGGERTGSGRQGTVEAPLDGGGNLAAAAEGGSDDCPGQAAVAHVERAEMLGAVALVRQGIKGNAALDDLPVERCRRLA